MYIKTFSAHNKRQDFGLVLKHVWSVLCAVLIFFFMHELIA